MTLSTATLDKKENGKKLREFHQPTFEKLGLVNPTIYGKMFYFPTGKTEKYVSLFFNEINKGTDVYLEATNRDFIPEDVERTLYLWKSNPHFQEEYEMTEPEITNSTRFLIPVSELKVVKKYTAEEISPVVKQPVIEETDAEKEIIENKDFDFDSPVKLTDKETPITEMTIRDFAAIILKKPVSRKEWLNEIIKSK